MKAIARRRHNYTHEVAIGRHHLIADEPPDVGGDDLGPNPQELLAASLASCVAITMEMYAKRKSWNVDGLEVEVDYAAGGPGKAAVFSMVLRLPAHLEDEQVDRLRVIAHKCPVHRTLQGEVAVEDRVELV